MRISDWSSDVCSSDLRKAGEAGPRLSPAGPCHAGTVDLRRAYQPRRDWRDDPPDARTGGAGGWRLERLWIDRHRRSEGRRVGKECVSKCGFRWCPYHYKQKTNNNAKDIETNKK